MSLFHRQLIKAKRRWLQPLLDGVGSTSVTATAARVNLMLFEVTETVTVDQIVWINAGTVAGNVIAGIYGPVSTEDTADAAPLAVESESVAQSGVNAPQAVSITPTVLRPGRYYVALQFSDGTATFLRLGSTTTQVTGWAQTYTRGGGFGALTNPCPAPSASTQFPAIRIRCVV